MKRQGVTHSLGIRARVLILAVLPLVTLVSLLGYHLANTRLEDAAKETAERGALMARNLALASEFALFSQNTPLLRETLQRIANQPEVRWAAVWDKERQSMVTNGVSPYAVENDTLVAGLENGAKLPHGLFHAPVRVTDIKLSDFNEGFAASGAADASTSSQLLGYALIQLTLTKAELRRADIVSNTILIMLSGLFASILLALLIGNSITEPVLRILNTVRDLRRGNLEARVHARAGGEIGNLAQDVNEMAAALQNAQLELEARVELATRALKATVDELETRNHELERAKQLALRAGVERTQFLARMSHEIRTPLNAVIGFARMLEANGHAESNEEHLRTIQLAAEQLLHVINDILQFIRLDAGATRLENLPFSVGDLLEDVVVMLGPMASERELELILLLHSDLPATMQGDPARLSQIVVNLVNNAVKFTAKGHVALEASRLKGPNGEENIEISVSDTGIGLDPREQQEIFAAFSQSDSSINRRFGGTGLGLAIAKQLCELMGGEIRVDSVKGEGSVFTVRLPCDACSAPAQPAAPASLTGKRVLVYDINPLMRRSLRNMLAAWGMPVFNAGTWDRVLSLVADTGQEYPFDLVILSLAFAEHDAGILQAYLSELRKHYPGQLLLLSGSETGVPSASGESDGRIAWFRKPVRRATLQRQLGQLLARTTPPRRAATPGPHAARLRGLRILAVEDNGLNRQLLRHQLEDEGAVMHEAESGQAAIDASRQAAYDAILMDLHMPGIDGIEAARRIRAQLGDQAPPIIALTADVFGRSDQKNAEGCFDAWLLKPADPEQLTQTLLGFCRRSASGPEPAPLRGGQSRALPPELCLRYQREIMTLADRLQDAVDGQDTGRASSVIHELKGLAGVYRDRKLAELFQRLEHHITEGEATEATAALGRLRDALRRIEPCQADDQTGT